MQTKFTKPPLSIEDKEIKAAAFLDFMDKKPAENTKKPERKMENCSATQSFWIVRPLKVWTCKNCYLTKLRPRKVRTRDATPLLSFGHFPVFLRFFKPCLSHFELSNCTKFLK